MNQAIIDSFDKIYSTDLTYHKDCWLLCGDAHCCSFSRYKNKFSLIAKEHFQELPLLPYEYEYLEHKNWLDQFGNFEHKIVDYPLDGYTIKAESIISRRPNCACDHATRTTICRLYPVLPVFDITGRLLGTDKLGIYEELEDMDKIEPACKVTDIPFDQLEKFLTIASIIGANKKLLFYVMAYRITKMHIRKRLNAAHSIKPGSAFALFERQLIRKRLIDHEVLTKELNALTGKFVERYDFKTLML